MASKITLSLTVLADIVIRCKLRHFIHNWQSMQKVMTLMTNLNPLALPVNQDMTLINNLNPIALIVNYKMTFMRSPNPLVLSVN